MIHAQREPLVREMFIVHKPRKINDVVMLKFVRTAVQRTDKIYILNHGEQVTFRDGT